MYKKIQQHNKENYIRKTKNTNRNNVKEIDKRAIKQKKKRILKSPVKRVIKNKKESSKTQLFPIKAEINVDNFLGK